MKQRILLVLVCLAVVTGGCSHLGLGEASCLPPERGVSSANILTIQAVPTAKYTPCLSESRLGWDTVEWFAEDGRAGLKFTRSISPFLTATVTESCDVTGAAKVESGFPDIERFEDIEAQLPEIAINVVPTTDRALVWARLLVENYAGLEMDGRPVVFSIDEDIEQEVGPRLNQALLRNQYAWMVSELDAEEGKVELRGEGLDDLGRGVTPVEALNLIEDSVPDVFYRGSWYFTFEGGCITYEFNARGILAETIAADAEEVFGFYPASLVVEVAERDGLIIK